MAIQVEQLIQELEAKFRRPFDEIVNLLLKSTDKHFKELHERIISVAKELEEDKNRFAMSASKAEKNWKHKAEEIMTQSEREEAKAGRKIGVSVPFSPKEPD